MSATPRSGLHRRAALIAHRTSRLPPTVKGLLWASAAGLVFSILNSLMRSLTLQLDPFQAQFLRYFFGLVVLAPLMLRHGLAAYWPQTVRGQLTRGAIHTAALFLWFLALPKIPLADTTAIGFTAPIFVMLGAHFVFKEAMRWERWVAALLGFAGVLIVVAPKLQGGGGVYSVVMLGSAPLFAASFLLTKALTRYETTGVILVWQAISVTLFSIPLAVLHWKAPTTMQWLSFLLCGLMGSIGHYCLTRSMRVADISATQSAKFLDLLWAALLGWIVFGDIPSRSTLIGGIVICASTIWIARRESRNPSPVQP